MISLKNQDVDDEKEIKREKEEEAPWIWLFGS